MNRKPERTTVLITGHAGFTGRHVVEYLRGLSEPPRIIGLDVCKVAVRGIDRQVVGDIGRFKTLSDVLARYCPAYVLHLAGKVPPAEDSELWAGNVGLAVILLEVVRARPRPYPRILLVGSAAEYGLTMGERVAEDHPCTPTTVYGRTKLAQTLLCRAYANEWGLPVVTVRPFNLIGPGMTERSVLGTICAQLVRASRGGRVVLGKTDRYRDFLDVRDAAAAYWLVAQHGVPGESYNVCSGRAISISELAARAVALNGRSVSVQSDADRVCVGDVGYSHGDCTKLTTLTGWRPRVALETSLRDTVAWFHGRAKQLAR